MTDKDPITEKTGDNRHPSTDSQRSNPQVAKANFQCAFLSTMISASLTIRDEDKARYFARELHHMHTEILVAKSRHVSHATLGAIRIIMLISIGALIGTTLMLASGTNGKLNLQLFGCASLGIITSTLSILITLYTGRKLATFIRNQADSLTDRHIRKILDQHRKKVTPIPLPLPDNKK